MNLMNRTCEKCGKGTNKNPTHIFNTGEKTVLCYSDYKTWLEVCKKHHQQAKIEFFGIETLKNYEPN